MDRFEGRCWLDWWANPSTNFGDLDVSVVIAPTETGWEAHGRLISELISDDDREGFAVLCAIDPMFTLRFQDGSTLDVNVTPIGDDRFTLAEYTGPPEQPIMRRVVL